MKTHPWAVLGGVTLAMLGILLAVPPIPQWVSYHQFADQRTLLGVPHFMDVISNLPFFLVAFLGFQKLSRQSDRGFFKDGKERVPYFFYFFSVLLVGFGSTYYHLAPDNARLVWDRIPITLVVMSLVSIVLLEKVGAQESLRGLAALLVLGIGSVLYWKWTGDLRFYGFFQFYPVLFVALVLWFFPKPFPAMRELVALAVCYGLAKVFETFDEAVYRATTGLLSGHTLKHILAALSVYWILWVLRKRKTGNS